MRRMDKLDLKYPDLRNVPGFYAMEQDVVEHPKLLETFFSQGMCKTGGIDRKIKLSENVRQSSDMVFVAVREDDGGKVIAILFQKIEVRDRNIYAEGRLLRKSHPRIDNDHLVTVADPHTIHPEFANTSERDYLYFVHTQPLICNCLTNL